MTCYRDSGWCFLVRFLHVRDTTHNKFVPVQTDKNVVIEKRPLHQDGGFPGSELLLSIPDVGGDYSRIFFFIFVSLICLLITVIFKESSHATKLNNFISSHIFHLLVGVIIAFIEYGAFKDAKEKPEPIYIGSTQLQTFLVPLLFESTFAMYNKHFFDQFITIATIALVTNYISVSLVGFINWNVTWELFDWKMTWSQMFSMIIISNSVHILAVYSYFPVRTSPRHKYFYLMIGIHQLQNISTEGSFEIVLALAPFKLDNQAKPSSLLYLILRTVLSHLASIVVGTIVGLTLVLVSRLTRQVRKSCKYYEPYLIVFGLISTYILCRAYMINRSLGVIFCSFIQQRYSYCNFSKDSIMAVKTGIRAISLEVEIIFYVLVGYQIANIVNRDEFYFSMLTMCLLFVIRALVILLVSFIMNMTSSGRIGWKLQALIIFGALRGPRTIGFILQLSGKPYDTRFINGQFYIIIISLLVDTTISKYLSSVIREAEPDGVVLPGEKTMNKVLKWLMVKEKHMYEILVK